MSPIGSFSMGIVLLALLLILPSTSQSVAVHTFDCKKCHIPSLSVSQLGSGNVCLSCHDETLSLSLNDGTTGTVATAFTLADASNALGNNSSPESLEQFALGHGQTSHSWAVSDTQPRAGAVAPLPAQYPQFYSRYGSSVGKVTCTRCHNPHATETNPQLLVLGAGSAQQMCLACHAPWKQNGTDKTNITHPVGIDYATAAAPHAGSYAASPPEDDGNLHTNGPISLFGGKIMCGSCHQVHFADSNASTADTPENFAILSMSGGDGKLLRGDGAGRADKSSFCRTCHTYQAHGDTTGERIGCLVCHGGHSYDPVAPNYFMLRKSAKTTTYNTVNGLNYSSADVLDPASKYRYWNDQVDGTANGYCEKCHGDARNIGSGAGSYHVASAVCTDCHQHTGELGTFSASCGACHGNGANDASWPDGIANNILPAYSWADDAGSHAVHVAVIGTRNLSCTACHPGNPPVDHYLDAVTGSQQAEVARMDTDGNGAVNYWQYAEGADAIGGTPVYLKTLAAGDDTDAYYRTTNQTCYNVNCHGNVDLRWGTSGCLGCHSVAQGARAAVGGQFAANSHHVQGVTVSGTHCYACHWEANSDGTIAPAYHGGTKVSGATVDLVIYGAGTRPSDYAVDSTVIQYIANGSRTEIAKLNGHCLSCHSDINNLTTPFGDGRTPKQYAWDGTSVAARYSQPSITTWGKSAFYKQVDKALSAHGNAMANAGGFSAANGEAGTLPNTRAGSQNVQCYDCHNSHGSSAAGMTSSYLSFSGSQNGGLLKDTQAGRGGYTTTYRAQAITLGVSPAATGSAQCFDCHETADGDAAGKPWGYETTFGAVKPIHGYNDTPRFQGGGGINSARMERFAYRTANQKWTSHFKPATPLIKTPEHQLQGLCANCHDPHGVSPTLGSGQAYAVPLLKGTWMTSPFYEDRPAPNAYCGSSVGSNNPGYSIGSAPADDSLFAGLCLRCHLKAKLTDGINRNSAWKSVDRLHETVKGWGANTHQFTCSKCHAPHVSNMPRLMVSNCLDVAHMGLQTSGGVATRGSGVNGSGQFTMGQNGWNDNACHAPRTGSWTNQYWNSATPWQ